MKKYKLFIHGENFLLNLDQSQKHGFYTTRFVEAENEGEAEEKAVGMLRNDSNLRDKVSNAVSDPPKMFVEKIVELNSFEGIDLPGTGYTFYVEENVQTEKSQDN